MERSFLYHQISHRCILVILFIANVLFRVHSVALAASYGEKSKEYLSLFSPETIPHWSKTAWQVLCKFRATF